MRWTTGAVLVVALLLSAAVGLRDAPTEQASAEIHLDDAVVAVDLRERTAGELRVDDVMGTAQVARLTEPLPVEGVRRATSYQAGDVAYWPDGPSIVIYTHDGSALPPGGLFVIGHVSSGMDALSGCARACPVRVAPPGGAADEP